MRTLRIFRLAVLLTQNNRFKFILVSFLVAIGVIVYFALSELSIASQNKIDSAVLKELGEEGVYEIEFASTLNLPHSQLINDLNKTLSPFDIDKLIFIERYPPLNPACPPNSNIGEVSINMIIAQRRNFPKFENRFAKSPFRVCIDGQELPRNSIRPVPSTEKFILGDGYVLDTKFSPLLNDATRSKSQLVAVLVLGKRQYLSNQVQKAIQRDFGSVFTKAGVSIDAAMRFSRVDSGASIRNANDGIRLVYTLISWLVLLLVSVAVLVSELFVVRDRSWLLGLSRAVGARKSDLIKLIFIEVFGITFTGLFIAITLSFPLSPLLENFFQTTFQTSFNLIRLDSLSRLSIFLILSIAIGSIYPAIRVLRLDPAETVDRH